MIKKIDHDKILSKYCHRDIADASVSVQVSDKLNSESYVGVKVDDYYNNTIKDKSRPKSVDFVVVVDCSCNSYKMYILELKGGKQDNYKAKDINEKFDTTIHDFLENRFRSIYCCDRYKYISVELYLLNPFPKGFDNYRDYIKFKRHIMDKDTLEKESTYDKIFKFRGKICRIQKEFPQAVLISK